MRTIREDLKLIMASDVDGKRMRPRSRLRGQKLPLLYFVLIVLLSPSTYNLLSSLVFSEHILEVGRSVREWTVTKFSRIVAATNIDGLAVRSICDTSLDK
jgi:hypothetical protein